ncbi:MAG: hypothetical protein MHPSP_004401, partial [Paramarteilia canceri]
IEIAQSMEKMIRSARQNKILFENMKKNQLEDEREQLEKRELIPKNLLKMPQLITDFESEQQTRVEKVKKAEDERKLMLLKARAKLQYKVEEHDVEFRQILAEKEEENLKEKKAWKRLRAAQQELSLRAEESKQKIYEDDEDE